MKPTITIPLEGPSVVTLTIDDARVVYDVLKNIFDLPAIWALPAGRTLQTETLPETPANDPPLSGDDRWTICEAPPIRREVD